MILFFILSWLCVGYTICLFVDNVKKFFRNMKLSFLLLSSLNVFGCIVFVALGYMSYNSDWGIQMITIGALFSVFRLPLLILGILFMFLIALVLMKRMRFCVNQLIQVLLVVVSRYRCSMFSSITSRSE